MGLFDIFKKKEKTVVTIYSPMNGKVIEQVIFKNGQKVK